MSRARLNIVLVGVLAGLGAVVWFTREKPEVLPPLTTLTADTLKQIVIEHPGAPLLRLEKQDEQWQIVAPVKAPTDPLEVAGLISLTTSNVERSLPLAEVSLAELGLEPPGYTVTLNDQLLAFGANEPIQARRYIRTGDHVALVSDPPSAALDADYSDLVAKPLLPEGAKIVRIEVPGLTVSRNAEGTWAADTQPDASAEKLQAFVDNWRKARSMWNAAMPADGASGGQAIRIVLEDGEIQLRLAATEPQLQIDRPEYGVRYAVSKAEEAGLLTLASAVMPASPDEAIQNAIAPASE
ncbi:MAG: DUF4340 domain-containing protein [Pseudomonadota bacterium]|nr:DUF4340 domain-containing protein [Pseudomonadota bacterium]